MKDRKALVVILLTCLISNILLITIWAENIVLYMISSGSLLVCTCLFENTASLTFTKIIPSNYEIMKINGSKFINYVTVIGRIIGSLMLFMTSPFDYLLMNRVVYGITAGLFLIIFLLIVAFYSNLRVKAIARILRNKNRRKTKASEF
jgi:predicted MFS family arabinose efflux permease